MVGKTVRSKINGALFQIAELREERGKRGKQEYVLVDMATGKKYAIGKEWFEKGYMQNLEIVNERMNDHGTENH